MIIIIVVVESASSDGTSVGGDIPRNFLLEQLSSRRPKELAGT